MKTKSTKTKNFYSLNKNKNENQNSLILPSLGGLHCTQVQNNTEKTKRQKLKVKKIIRTHSYL